jgi:parallel beta-helix repeat protein
MFKCVAGLKRTTVHLAGCLILICVTAPFLSAQNIINVPASQATIQGAINAANNGDTVLVAPGRYVENINFGGKAITVTSSGGPSVTTIDGGARGLVVTFNTGETPNSKLSGFTITNGYQNGQAGGGVLISGTSPTIIGNVITGNHAAEGIGIYVNGGAPLIQNNTITANDQKGAGDGGGGGGGILIAGTSSLPGNAEIIGNTITNNSVAAGGDGGGISITYFSSPLVQGNLVQGNTAYNNGGGISVSSYDSPIVAENIIVNNSVLGYYSGGGMWVSPGSFPQTFVNNTIVGNTAIDNTSGIFVTGFGQYALFTNNIIVAASGQVAVTCNSSYSSMSPAFSSNDAFSISGQNWSGICNATGQYGNISADPQFLTATDFHLQWGSPAVDAGSNVGPYIPSVDFDGNMRPFDGNGDGYAVIDLGAYELVPTTISLTPNNLTFGPQPLGSTSPSQAVTLTNTGNWKLLLAISIDANFAQTNNCGSSLAAGASCSINVSFSPATNGNLTGNLTLHDTASNNPQSVALAGTGGAPAASLTPTSLDFGAQAVGVTSAAQMITLSNTGDDLMGVAGITSSGDFAQTNTCGTTLAAGASCSISVTFTPTAVGTRSGSVTVADNASGSPQSVALTGTGTAPMATVSPASLAFPDQFVGTTSAPMIVTLSNSGSGALSIGSIGINGGPFLQTNNCPASLAAGSSCAINVSFSPVGRGSVTGTLMIEDNSSGSPQTVSLSGTGVAPVASFSSTALTFAPQIVTTVSAPQTITLSNVGTAPMTINAISTTSSEFTLNTACGTSLSVGANCTIKVTFAPSAWGDRSGLL